MRTKLDSMKTRPGDIKVLPPAPSSPAPRRWPRKLWSVDLEVVGRFGTWQWSGFATDSIEATELAKRDFYGPMFDDELVRKRHPVKVLSVLQVGV